MSQSLDSESIATGVSHRLMMSLVSTGISALVLVAAAVTYGSYRRDLRNL